MFKGWELCPTWKIDRLWGRRIRSPKNAEPRPVIFVQLVWVSKAKTFAFFLKKMSFWSSPCRVMVTGALSGPSIVHGDDPTMFLCSVHLPWQGRRPRSKTMEEKETLAGGPAGPPWNRAAAICLLPLFPINCHLWLSLINCYRWFSCRKFNSICRKKHAIFVSPYKLLKNRFKFYHMIIIMYYKY